MMKPDHETLREWLQLEADGDLPPERRDFLASHLASCLECQDEQRDLARLAEAMTGGRLPVRADFRQRVMESLPAAGWEARHPQTWRFPAAVALLFGIVAATFFGWGAAAPAGAHSAGSPVAGALLALAGFFRATLVAGLGLIHASWKGWGMIFGELFASRLTLAALAVLVICLNLLLISLVRRNRLSRLAGEIAPRGRARG
jgi:anti-sigma factor RsiW